MKAINTKRQDPHLGEMFKNFMQVNKLSRTGLAQRLQKGYSTVYRYENSHNLQSNIVWELSVALKHNFFADLAAKLPGEFTSNVPQDTSKDEQIKALEAKLNIANAQLEILKEVMKAD